MGLSYKMKHGNNPESLFPCQVGSKVFAVFHLLGLPFLVIFSGYNLFSTINVRKLCD